MLQVSAPVLQVTAHKNTEPLTEQLKFYDSAGRQILRPHRSFSDYYLLSGDFVVEQKTILLIINYLVIL